MKNKILLNAFLILVFTYTSIIYANFLINYDAWIGHSINELTNSWGYADGSFEAPNGNKVYFYTTYKANEADSVMTIGKLKIRNNNKKFCKKFFEANNDIIVSWNMKGNNCQSIIGDRRAHPTIPPKIKTLVGNKKPNPVIPPETRSQTSQLAQILEIKRVCSSVLQGKNTAQLEIYANGNVNSAGWTNPMLIPWVYRNGQSDNGTLHFTFIANKPSNINTQIITSIKASNIIADKNWLKAIVVHTSTNDLQTKIGGCSI